jgi:hypothetical protein
MLSKMAVIISSSLCGAGLLQTKAIKIYKRFGADNTCLLGDSRDV